MYPALPAAVASVYITPLALETSWVVLIREKCNVTIFFRQNDILFSVCLDRSKVRSQYLAMATTVCIDLD